MEPTPKPVHEQIYDLLPGIAEAYRAHKSAANDELRIKSRMQGKAEDVLSVNSIFVYQELDAIIIRKESASELVKERVNKVCALLPSSMLSEMRNNKKRFSFNAGVTQVTIWFENFEPKIDMQGPGF